MSARRRSPSRAQRARIALLAAALALGCGVPGARAYANDIVRGGEIYRQHCATCHGASGVSTWPGAPNIARREGMLQPDRVLVERIRAGRNAMPAYQGMINERDLLSVVAYMRTLGR
jgi:mono/diheme cytochrome c family protein